MKQKHTKSSGAKYAPTFSPLIREKMPLMIRDIMNSCISDMDSDMITLGAITVMSAALPNLYGLYDKRQINANLYYFLVAPASTGKGRLTLTRLIVEPIHSQMREEYEDQLADFKAKMMKAKHGEDISNIHPPKQKLLIIPANSSSTAMYQTLNDNGGVGLMFETEGDTLSNTMASEHGNYSDGLRKAFHHEPITYRRRKENEYVEINKPRLSVVLSGTPNQVRSLIDDTEDGLFSRMMFYAPELDNSWKNVFEGDLDGHSDDEIFSAFGQRFLKIYTTLKSRAIPLRFILRDTQKEQFNQIFMEMQTNMKTVFGDSIVASIRRLGVICYRIAMVLTVLDREESLDTLASATTLICPAPVFDSAVEIIRCLSLHTVKVFESMPEGIDAIKANNKRKRRITKLLDALPPHFDRPAYQSIGETLGYKTSTNDKYINIMLLQRLIKKTDYNQYEKIAPDSDDTF